MTPDGRTRAGILAVAIPVILGIANAPELRAQAESVPKFEVASVRPSPPLQLPIVVPFRSGIFLDGGRVECKLMSLRDLIVIAYRIKPFQLTGGPNWLAIDVFDIVATIPQGASATRHCASDIGPCSVSATKVPEMLQALLAERFGLRIRREEKEMPVYALTAGRGGPKFREVLPDDTQAEFVFPKPPEGGIVTAIGGVVGVVDPAVVRIGPARGLGDGKPIFDGRGKPTVESFHIEISKATMAQFANFLTSRVDRPVVDRTGLTGTYEIGFDVPSQDMSVGSPMPGKIPRAAPPSEDPTGSSFFQIVQSLGLRLEKDKASIETIVVEHIEKTPTEN
jgi:uncharacterized protein (TIGR03435 family)